MSQRDKQRISSVVRRVETGFEDQTNPEQRFAARQSLVPVAFQNDDSTTIPAYGVGLVTGVMQLGGLDLVKVKQANEGVAGVCVVNGPVPVESKKMGQGYLSGRVRVLLDTPGLASGDKVGPLKGKWSAGTSGSPTFDLLGVLDASNRIGMGLLGGSGIAFWYGVTDVDIPAGGNGSVSIWELQDGAYHDTGENIDMAWAPFILTAGRIAKDKKVWMTKMGQQVHILNWEC